MEEAGEVLFTASSPVIFELLVMRRRWSIEVLQIRPETITHALLP